MFSLPRGKIVHLSSSRLKRTCVLTANAEQKNLSDVTEVEPNTPTVRSSIFPDFVPDEIAFVLKAPGLHDFEAFWKERVWYPKVEMANRSRCMDYGQRLDLLERHRGVTSQTVMLWGDFASSILKLPRRIGQNRSKSPSVDEATKIFGDIAIVLEG